MAGHRLGTKEIEEVVSSHPAVAEVSVIGVTDSIKGEVPLCLTVLKIGNKPSDEMRIEINKLIRRKVGPLAAPRDVFFVRILPKTRSGKYMRRVMRAIYEGQSLKDLSTIEDGASVDEVKMAIEQMKRELR